MKKSGEFFERLREYNLRQKPNGDYLKEEYLEEDGAAVVCVDLEGAELYHPMSMGEQTELNPEIYAFIDEKVYPIPSKTPVTLKMYGVEKGERSRVERLIREHYDLRFRDKKDDLKLNFIKSTVLFVIGAVLLALYFVLANSNIQEVWYEIFSIIATFIVWSAAEIAILERHELKVEYFEKAQMVLMRVAFIDE